MGHTMHFDFFEQYQAKQKAYEKAKLLVETLSKHGNLNTNGLLKPTAHRILEQVEQAKKNIFSGIPLEVLTEILELTADGLSMDLALDVPNPLLERYDAVFNKLKTINTKESYRLKGIIAGIVGLILIATCIALIVLNPGAMIALLFLPIAAKLYGTLTVLSGAFGGIPLVSAYYDIQQSQNVPSDINGLADEKDAMPYEMLSSEFELRLKGDFFTTNGDALKSINLGDYTRIFNDLLMSEISNKKAYDTLIKASKKGKIGVHLQQVAKSMSRAFLDENHNLLPAIKEKLKITECSKQEERRIVGQLLQATIALYTMAATAHSADVSLEENDRNNSTISTCACDLYNKAIITADSVFCKQKPAWYIPTQKLIEDFIDVYRTKIRSLETSGNLSDEQQNVFDPIIAKLDYVSCHVLDQNPKIEKDKAVTSEQEDEFGQVKNIEACLAIEHEIKPKIEAAMKMGTVSEEQKAILQEMIGAYHHLAIKNNLGDVPGPVSDIDDDVGQQLRIR